MVNLVRPMTNSGIIPINKENRTSLTGVSVLGKFKLNSVRSTCVQRMPKSSYLKNQGCSGRLQC